MRKSMRKVRVHESEREVVDATVCDICGRKTGRNGWTKDHYDVAETRVESQVGVSYPEDSWGEIWEIDVCPECFRDKLIPWVESFGHAKIESRSWGS